jgi:putative hydrolase of the HAD superfamily
MHIRAILFDLDNTLTHRDHSIRAYSRQLLQHYQQAWAEPPSLAQLETLIRRIDNGGYPDLAQLTHPSIAASVGYALQQQLSWQQCPSLEELTAFWFSQFARCAVLMPDAKIVLAALKAQGYRLGVISNGGHESRLHLIDALGLTDYFELIHSSGLLGVKKPQAEIFLQTAQALALQPSECLFVGDHPINDMQGAQQAGMQALWLAGFHALPEQMQVATITQLRQILEFVPQPAICI